MGEGVRRRSFGHLGDDRFRKRASRGYADWCFERRERLPPQWTLVDSAATEAKAREQLRARFEACYPFHPAARPRACRRNARGRYPMKTREAQQPGRRRIEILGKVMGTVFSP